jgi:hypothetical protein
MGFSIAAVVRFGLSWYGGGVRRLVPRTKHPIDLPSVHVASELNLLLRDRHHCIVQGSGVESSRLIASHSWRPMKG